jgi:MSHA biogenesis protein MshI
VNQHAEINEIFLLEEIKFDDFKSLPLILKGLVDRYKLTTTPVYWLLETEDYQLNLIESMPVPKNEFLKALTWRVRSLINYPIEDAAFEYFELPSKKSAPNAPLIGSVTSQKSRLHDIISLCKDSGLSIVKIDIPELALLNLASIYENDDKSTAFIYFYSDYVILNISNRKTLYFTRRITLSINTDKEIDYEKLSLEILRYFDFFRSQWRFAAPARIFVAADTGNVDVIANILTEKLLNPVEKYILNSTFLDEKKKSELSDKYLLDYGCILKRDGLNASTRN